MKRVGNESSGGKENSLLNIRMLEQILSARSRCEQFFFIIAFVVLRNEKIFLKRGRARPIVRQRTMSHNFVTSYTRSPSSCLMHVTASRKITRGIESARGDLRDNEKSTPLIALSYTCCSRYFLARIPCLVIISLSLSFFLSCCR